MRVPTVRVKSSHPEHERGFYVINESDFDKAKHELWSDEGPGDEAARLDAEREARRAEIKREEAMKAAAAIKAAQVNSGKPVLGMSSGAKPDQPGLSSGAGSDRK